MKIRRQRILDLYMIFWGTVFVAYLTFSILYIYRGLADPNYTLAPTRLGGIRLMRIHR